MDVLAKANAAVQAGADPYDVWKLLDGNPAQEQFGKQHIVQGDWVPKGAEFDEGEDQMVWPVLAALGSLFTPAAGAAGAAGGAAAAPAAAAAPGVGGGLAQTAGVPEAFSGLGGALPTNPEGRSLWTDLLPSGPASGGAPPEVPWYQGLLSGDAPGGGAQSQSMSNVQAPALQAIPAQQRRERERMQFNLPPALRSLMGG